MGNDVHTLACNLVRDRLHTRAAHTDASADWIDAGIVAAYRDLRAHTGIAGRAENLDETLSDFRDLELEQLHEELRRRPGQEQLRPAGLGADLLQKGLDAVLGLHLLARNHVSAGDEAFRVAAEIDVDTVTIDALHHAADEGTDPVAIRIDDLRPLGLAHFLHDDLLRLLGGDTAEGHRFHRLLDVAANLDARIDLQRVFQTQLTLGHLQLLGVVRENLPAPEGLVVAALTIDGDARIPLLPVFLTGGGRQRRFQRL